jgi:hypothetical protein
MSFFSLEPCPWLGQSLDFPYSQAQSHHAKSVSNLCMSVGLDQSNYFHCFLRFARSGSMGSWYEIEYQRHYSRISNAVYQARCFQDSQNFPISIPNLMNHYSILDQAMSPICLKVYGILVRFDFDPREWRSREKNQNVSLSLEILRYYQNQPTARLHLSLSPVATNTRHP